MLQAEYCQDSPSQGVPTCTLWCFVQELYRREDVRLARLHNATIHNHFLQHEMCFLQMEHDVQLTLQKVQMQWRGVESRQHNLLWGDYELTTLPKWRSIVSTKRCINSKMASSFCKKHNQTRRWVRFDIVTSKVAHSHIRCNVLHELSTNFCEPSLNLRLIYSSQKKQFPKLGGDSQCS